MVDFKSILGTTEDPGFIDDPEQDPNGYTRSRPTKRDMNQDEMERHIASLPEQTKNEMMASMARREKALSTAKKAKLGALLIPVILIILFAMISSHINMGVIGVIFVVLTPFICLKVSWRSRDIARKEFEIFKKLNNSIQINSGSMTQGRLPIDSAPMDTPSKMTQGRIPID